MKKLILLFVLFSHFAFAQDEMSTVWEVKQDFKSENYDIDFKRGLMYSSDDKTASVVQTADGKVVWTKKFKDITDQLKKVDVQIVMWDANELFCFDRKAGKDKIACIDINTGDLLWTTEAYQDLTEENIIYLPEMEAFAVSTKLSLTLVKARTGEELWTTTKFKGVIGAYSYDKSDQTLVMLNYKPSGLAALFSGFKNQLTRINMKNGDVIWDQTYVGIMEKKVWTREPTAHIDVTGGKVFLYLNGIQVYDYKTGAQLWNAAFDFTVDVIKPPAGAIRFGVYGAVADPLVVGNDVYVLDFKSAKKQTLKKYDLKSGKLLWTSPEIPDAKAIPGLYLVDNTVVLQMGGQVECQAYIKEESKQGNMTYIRYYYKKYYRVAKPLGIMAYDATNGKMLWESERFKKDITNAFPSGKDLIVASGKALYSVDIKSGKENYEVLLGDDNIGWAQKIIDYKDNVIIVGEKGVASHNKTDGKMQKAAKYKSSDYAGMYGNMLMMETEKADIAVYDVETCKYKQYDARKDANSKLSDDGQFVYVWDKKELVKLSTK